MAQTRNPKGAQRKLIQDRLRDGYDTLFSGKEEPPTDLSIRQADELRARVAELEAKLEQQSGVVEKKSPSTAVVTDSQSRYTSAAQPPQQEDVISVWRERLVNFILRVGVVIGFIGWVVYLFIDIPKQNWGDLTVITIVLAVLTAITFLKVPYVVRSYGLVALVFSLYLNALMQSGVRGDANVFLLTAVILALMLLGLRPGMVVMGIAILAMMGAGWVVTNHQFTLSDLFDQLNPSTWIAHGVATDMMAAILATGIIMLQREFSSAQKRERTAMDEVYRERGHLAMRVEERTHDLQLASEVGRTITEKVANLHEMLTTAAEMIRTRFGLYYTQVYLMDPSRKSLTLRAGTGNVGQELLKRGHHLPISSGSINGRAAVERKVVIVEDTTTSPTFLPNPLLPNTRSEMAIPLIAGGQVIGVLDMQSETPGALNQGNLPALEALAGQLAIAIQNATLFTEAEQARFEVEVQVHRLTKQGWQDFLDAIERGQKIGFSFDQTSIIPLEADAISLATIEETFSTPITVTGTKIGAIEFAHEPDRIWTANETELIQLTANQLGQHVENLRLLAQAEKYRAEAEDAVRRLTREGWDTYLKMHNEENVGFAFDQNEVHPLNEGGNGNNNLALVHPLTIQNEIVGELSVNPGEGSQEDANELISAVATQLSAHIENLRLTQQTEQALVETEDLYRGSEKIVKAATIPDVLAALIESTTLGELERAALTIFDHPWDPKDPPAGMTIVSSWISDAEEAIVPVGTYYHLAEFPAAKFLALNEITIFADIATDPRFDEHSRKYFLETLKLKSIVSLPLVVDGRSIGGIVAQSSQALKISDGEIRKIATLLGQVTTVIQSKRLLEQVRERVQREQALRQITTALRSSTNPATIMRTAVSELGSILGRKTVVQLSTPERTDQAASTAQDANGSGKLAPGSPSGDNA